MHGCHFHSHDISGRTLLCSSHHEKHGQEKRVDWPSLKVVFHFRDVSRTTAACFHLMERFTMNMVMEKGVVILGD